MHISDWRNEIYTQAFIRETMMILIFCLQYIACHILYQADRQHSAFQSAHSSLRIRIAMRIAAIGVMLFTLYLLSRVIGFERALPMGIALLSIAGVLHVLANAFCGQQYMSKKLFSRKGT